MTYPCIFQDMLFMQIHHNVRVAWHSQEAAAVASVVLHPSILVKCLPLIYSFRMPVRGMVRRRTSSRRTKKRWDISSSASPAERLAAVQTNKVIFAVDMAAGEAWHPSLGSVTGIPGRCLCNSFAVKGTTSKSLKIVQKE